MKRMLPFLALVLCGASGCMGPCGTGVEFRIIKPPTVRSDAVISQAPGQFLINPMSAYPAQPAGTPGRGLAYLDEPVMPRPGPTLASRASCTMQDVCDGLERIERLLRTQALPMPRPKE